MKIKGADQLRGTAQLTSAFVLVAKDSATLLLPKSKISSDYPSPPICVRTAKTGFLATRLIYDCAILLHMSPPAEILLIESKYDNKQS